MSSELEWRAMWDLFDTSKTNSLPKADFIRVSRILGRRYTDEQFAEKTKSMAANVGYEDFLIFMRTAYTGPTESDLLNALKAFDGKETGELTTAQLQAILTTMGEKMSSEDAAKVMESIHFSASGKLSIEDIAKGLNPPPPSAKPNIEELMQSIIREELAKM
eukprot:PhF_6_TR6729/c0_g1_i1/m.9739/K02183/CALM; calmodulin